jgi:hypothetical protein
MLKKQYVKSRKVWKITFELPEAEISKGSKVRSVHLAGEFNGWDPAALPMARRQGAFRTTVELEPGQQAPFRYLINGEYWYNDPHSDGYVPNGFGEDNCVVTVPALGHI